MSWETPNIRKLIERLKDLRNEVTMSANAGAFAVPIGGMLRRTTGAQDAYVEPDDYPSSYSPLKKKRKR